jgi:hypothetical protein
VNTTESADIALPFGTVAGQRYASPAILSLSTFRGRFIGWSEELAEPIESDQSSPERLISGPFPYAVLSSAPSQSTMRTSCCWPSGRSTDSEQVLCAVYDDVNGVESNSEIMFT